jgi:hypothetical protein
MTLQKHQKIIINDVLVDESLAFFHLLRTASNNAFTYSDRKERLGFLALRAFHRYQRRLDALFLVNEPDGVCRLPVQPFGVVGQGGNL